MSYVMAAAQKISIEKFLVAVPARLESSRLSNKVLLDIGGKPMIRRVLERSNMAAGVDAVVLCTDSDYLKRLVEGWGYRVQMTSTECTSGSERIASVADELIALVWAEGQSDPSRTAVINVQGDQPFLDPSVIECMVSQFQRCDPPPSVVTPVYALQQEFVHDPNVVKTVLSHDGRALYFSRAAVPHIRDVDPSEWHRYTTYWGHVGIYGFRGDVLRTWEQLPPSTLEDLERLEQLRLLEAGYSIATFPVEGTSLSVDTAEQLAEARAVVRRSATA